MSGCAGHVHWWKQAKSAARRKLLGKLSASEAEFMNIYNFVNFVEVSGHNFESSQT
jgi:hypothetical protein